MEAENADSAARSSGQVHTSGAEARVMERMTLNAEGRLKEAERRKEEARENMDPRENVALFHLTSGQAREEWQQKLGHVCSGAGLTEQEVKGSLDELATQLQKMEGQLAQASYFLPAYDQRSTRSTLKEMQAALEEARAKLIPKKKFSFGSRVARRKAADVADASTSAALSAASTAGASSEGAVEAPEVKAGRGLEGLCDRSVAVTAEQLGGGDFTLVDLQDCTVFLLGRMSALRCHRLTRCKVFSGPVAGSSFVDAVTDSLLQLPSHQVRVHSSHNTDFYLRVRSNPIIEHSSGLRVAPFSFEAWPNSRQLLSGAGLSAEDEAVADKWQRVDDFGWLRAAQSPNWSVVPEGERVPAPPAPDGWGATDGALDPAVELSV